MQKNHPLVMREILEVLRKAMTVNPYSKYVRWKKYLPSVMRTHWRRIYQSYKAFIDRAQCLDLKDIEKLLAWYDQCIKEGRTDSIQDVEPPEGLTSEQFISRMKRKSKEKYYKVQLSQLQKYKNKSLEVIIQSVENRESAVVEKILGKYSKDDLREAKLVFDLATKNRTLYNERTAFNNLTTVGKYKEIDAILTALAEKFEIPDAFLVEKLVSAGFNVKRMIEDLEREIKEQFDTFLCRR
eukprot:TRINITY_DN98171_c0_g1_i1.p1 TRINITY_DN98171_c0_g1~~TRINITY_DN98171_c0_g1_i1.p1  ORF type:complete len:262 (-),score=28.84 TRINITY_DN98171_c0_g1_i1:37-756(-)